MIFFGHIVQKRFAHVLNNLSTCCTTHSIAVNTTLVFGSISQLATPRKQLSCKGEPQRLAINLHKIAAIPLVVVYNPESFKLYSQRACDILDSVTRHIQHGQSVVGTVTS